MNKTAIKNFAIWARTKLIKDMTYQAGLIGVSASGIAQPLAQSTKDLQFFDIGTKEYAQVAGKAISQRNALVKAIEDKAQNSNYATAFNNVIEEIAYTWFNRLVAIRFMEVNDYLPSRVRVLSSENPAKDEPDFVTNPFDTDLEFTAAEQDTILRLKDENKLDELFRMLFIKQCNKLYEILPDMFEKTNDYTELLLNISFTDKDGIVAHLVRDMDEEDWQDQVQIIGWLYQYYNTELKDDTFAQLKKNVKITKERIPAATQLFTPDWIVRYMVENSLGRLWVEGHPNEGLKENWKYYLEEAEQEADVQAQLEQIRAEYRNLNPEDIKVIDPCMGSGHILVYCFDVLMQIYESQGYTPRDAAQSILQHNLYGLDIDNRAAQLAYFAVMMKARQYDRRIFDRGIKPHVYAILESNNIDSYTVEYFSDDTQALKKDIQTLINELHDAKEYGSILNITQVDFNALYARFAVIQDDVNIYRESALRNLLPLVQVAEAMAQKYDVVVTNPPYMGSSGMSVKLSDFVKKNYPDTKADLFAIFMEKCPYMLKICGIYSTVTMQSWMFLSSFEELRNRLLSRQNLISVMHMNENVMGIAFGTSVCVARKKCVNKYIGCYHKIEYSNLNNQLIPNRFPNSEAIKYIQNERFKRIAGMPIAYWISENMLKVFEIGESIEKYVDTFQGIITGDNEKFLRLWHEVDYLKIAMHKKKMQEINLNLTYWIPYNKGGEFRKWYGIQDYVVNWKNGPDDKVRGKKGFSHYYLKEYVAWSYTVHDAIATRYYPDGFLWDVRGSGLMDKSEMNLYLEALISSKVGVSCFHVNNSTITCQVENILQLPIIIDSTLKPTIDNLTDLNNKLSQEEWDSFENSWDFKKHPLV